MNNSRELYLTNGKCGACSKQPCLLLLFHLVRLGKCTLWPWSNHWGKYLSWICVDLVSPGWNRWSPLWDAFPTVFLSCSCCWGSTIHYWAYSGGNKSSKEPGCVASTAIAFPPGGVSWNKQQSFGCSEESGLLWNLQCDQKGPEFRTWSGSGPKCQKWSGIGPELGTRSGFGFGMPLLQLNRLVPLW